MPGTAVGSGNPMGNKSKSLTARDFSRGRHNKQVNKYILCQAMVRERKKKKRLKRKKEQWQVGISFKG